MYMIMGRSINGESFRLLVNRAQLHEIVDLVTTMISDEGFRCLDAEFEAHTRTLRLFIDHASGVDLDACAKVSNLLVESVELDNIISGEFNLEISSPGVERPVRTIEDFRLIKEEGCLVKVGLSEKCMNRRKGVGRITSIDNDQTIHMSTTEGAWSFPWNLVLKATKVVDWNKSDPATM
jgi:ribosome maturation factor RimP